MAVFASVESSVASCYVGSGGSVGSISAVSTTITNCTTGNNDLCLVGSI